MILRPLEPAKSDTKDFLPAWDSVEPTQTQTYESCWMITQPSHAALAGELAANLMAPGFPTPDGQAVRAIALHDAGWGVPDAQAIMKCRSVHATAPHSFLTASLSQYLEAWDRSIEAAESVSAAGGYIVSRHFWRLAEPRIHSEQNKTGKQQLKSFLKRQEDSQQKMAARQPLGISQLEDLTDLLQFCDLLSLYLCCGTGDSVVFPEYFGIKLRIANHDGIYNLNPAIIKPGTIFPIAALRYPATKAESSRQIKMQIR